MSFNRVIFFHENSIATCRLPCSVPSWFSIFSASRLPNWLINMVPLNMDLLWLARTVTCLVGFRSKQSFHDSYNVFTYEDPLLVDENLDSRYLETPLCRTIFHFPWEFEIARVVCIYFLLNTINTTLKTHLIIKILLLLQNVFETSEFRKRWQ